MEFHFSAPVIEWRGPAPFFYADIPAEDSEDVKDAALGNSAVVNSDGRYLLPLRADVRRTEGIELGMTLEVGMSLRREGPAPTSPAATSGEPTIGT